MPYKSDKIVIAHSVLDRRIKLTQADKDEIRESVGLSIRALARKFGVDKRLIQFIKYPERLAECKKRRAERGGSKIYYDKEKQNEYMRSHRKYKHKLYLKGKIK